MKSDDTTDTIKREYYGEWRDNKIHGIGQYTFADGRRFSGEWRNNLMHGVGLYKWSDGKLFLGEYKHNVKSGYGIYKFKPGQLYMGNWKDGKAHGYGTVQSYEDKDIITRHGLWNNGKQVRWLDEAAVMYDNITNPPKEYLADDADAVESSKSGRFFKKANYFDNKV